MLIIRNAYKYLLNSSLRPVIVFLLSLSILNIGIICSTIKDNKISTTEQNDIAEILSDVVEEKCYKGLGCVKLDPHWWHHKYRPVNVLPSDRHAVNTIFLHWFLENGNLTSDILGDFKNDVKNLKLLVHDFTSNGYTGWIQHLSRAILTNTNSSEVNIVSVNWMAGAEPPFVQAVANARLVALEIIYFLKKLKEKHHLQPNQVHIVGHGLGAHIAGYVGKMHRLSRITALDPTGPYFTKMPAHVRLHMDDAVFVEVVHTDISPYGQGYADILGHVDFYPNGGKHQPGCVDVPRRLTTIRRDFLQLGETLSACSHKRSLKYYIEALIHPTCSFLGFACPSHKDFLKGRCTSCGDNLEHCARLPSEVRLKNVNNAFGFHFVTSSSAPFCVEMLKVLLVLQSKSPEQKVVMGFFNVSVPQPIGTASFLLNENHAISALHTDEHHVFMVFRSVPPPLLLPSEAVDVRWIQGPILTRWSSQPKIAALMLYKMTDKVESRPQWFCPANGSSDRSLDIVIGLEACEITGFKLNEEPKIRENIISADSTV